MVRQKSVSTKEPKVLVVEDGKNDLEPLRRILEEAGCRIARADNAREAMWLVESFCYDIIITSSEFENFPTLTLLEYLKRRKIYSFVLVYSSNSHPQEIVALIKEGAYYFLSAPFKPELAYKSISEILALLKQDEDIEAFCEEEFPLKRAIGKSDQWREIMEKASDVADTGASALIVGESGTGKEVIAKEIHKLSSRAKKPFVKAHCAALSLSIIESELFGHEKGAFTGAIRTSIGRFEAAHGGTLLLDEVDEIPMEVQVKLLRVIQEKEIERLGSSQSIPIDVRIIATTKKDLQTLAKEGKFRKDLFYRLAVVVIEIPPLYKRYADVAPLLNYFLAYYRHKMKKNIRGFSKRALDLLLSYNYPGNVRELEHIVESACALCKEGQEIKPEHLRINRGEIADNIIFRQMKSGCKIRPLKETLKECEREYLEFCLKRFPGTKTELASLLGISRKNLYEKIKEYYLNDIENIP